MKIMTLLGLIPFLVLFGCSGSSSATEAPAVGDALTLKSEQISFSNGQFATISYEYDEFGNLIGLVRDIPFVKYEYDIDANGRIKNTSASVDGVTFRASQIFYYDSIAGLIRKDRLGFIEDVGILGVAGIDVFKFEGDIATSLELRQIPFEDISINNRPDDSAGFIISTIEFEYDGERLIRELIDENGNGIVDTQRDYTYNYDGTLSSTLGAGMSANSSVFLYEQGACNHEWGNSTHRYFCVTTDDL